MRTPEQNRIRDYHVQEAWDALQPWVTLDERPGLQAVENEVKKMLARAYESGHAEAQKVVKRALGFPA